MTFQKRVEDFTCEHCGAGVRGSGFTNHCPKCLWSKHVDIEPGDRRETCGGMMEPIALEGSTPQYRLVHQCTRCGTRRPVHIADTDDKTALLAIAGRNNSGSK